MVIHPSWQLFGFSRNQFEKMDKLLGDVSAIFEPWSAVNGNPTLVHANSVDLYVDNMANARSMGRNPTAVMYVPNGMDNVPAAWFDYDEVVSASSRSWLRNVIACPFVIGLRAHVDQMSIELMATLFKRFGENPSDWPLDLLYVDAPVVEHLKTCAVYRNAWAKMTTQRLRANRTDVLAFAKKIVAVEIGIAAIVVAEKTSKTDKPTPNGKWKLHFPAIFNNAAH